jgi:gliding motility-associated-like protein
VLDPTPDGYMFMNNTECVDDTKIRFSLLTCNSGYATIPANTPITFYDADPRLPGTNKIQTYLLPQSIPGNCCTNSFVYTLDIGRRKLNTLFAVFNDNGTNKPLNLPNTPVIEKDYVNNVTVITNVAFRDTAFPAVAILEPGDTIQLTTRAGPGVVSSYTWSSPKNLSCTSCQSPFLIADSSTIKTVIAVSDKGCTDTAYVDIKVPPYNDYRVSFNDVQCAGRDSLYVNFSIYNDFKRAVLPGTLSVSFYNGNPALGNAVLLPPVFSIKDTIKAKQFTFSTFIKGISSGDIYAVINDSGKTLPISFPNTLLLEKNYANNTAVTSYKPETLVIEPSDTTVFRKDFVPLKINTTIYNAASTLWAANSGYALSCIVCPGTVVQVFDSSIVKAQTENRFGCVLTGTAAVNVFPPDMQVQITDTKCYTDNTALVTFSICMNNNYDSVYANIPVSFYDGNPANGARLLQPVFYTPQLQQGQCYTYITKISAPLTNQIHAVVNDKGSGRTTMPAKIYNETNYTNNSAQATYTPFRVNINPSDTFIQRLTSILLTPQAQGGTLSKFLWKPAQFLSCTSCATPLVTPQYTTRYELLAQNENFCTDTAIALVRTHIEKSVFVPDAFTPNKDQLNDRLYVLAGPDATIVKDFGIFNRWGQRIFLMQNVAPNNPAFGWNGKINGQDAATGTYVYFVTMAFADGSQQTFKGTVVLIR